MKFTKGKRVEYRLLNVTLFSGTIVTIDRNPKNKKYVILGDDGVEYYAHSEYLHLI